MRKVDSRPFLSEWEGPGYEARSLIDEIPMAMTEVTICDCLNRGFSRDVTDYKRPCHFPFMPVLDLQAWAINGQ